jgi:hypothetical protein
MQVRVDQTEETMDFPTSLSLGEIIDQISSQRIPENRVITQIRINGQDLLEDENGLYPDIPGREIESLELQTGLSREMAFRGLLDAKDYLKRLNPGIEKTAQLLRVGEEAAAHETYGQCMEGTNWFIQVLEGVRQVLGLDYGKIRFNKSSVHAHIDNLEKIIREMLRAQSDEDWVMLADLLEYELQPILEEWKEILPTIEKAAKTPEEGGGKR